MVNGTCNNVGGRYAEGGTGLSHDEADEGAVEEEPVIVREDRATFHAIVRPHKPRARHEAAPVPAYIYPLPPSPQRDTPSEDDMAPPLPGKTFDSCSQLPYNLEYACTR